MDQTGQNEIHKAICCFDDSIPWNEGGGPDRNQYIKEREFKTVAGHLKPQTRVFEYTLLRLEGIEDVMVMAHDVPRFRTAFQLCVKAIRIGDRLIVPAGKSWTMDELKEHTGHSEIQEIGGLIVQASILPKGFVPAYLLQPSSRHAILQRRESPYAAPSQTDAAQSKTPPAGA